MGNVESKCIDDREAKVIVLYPIHCDSALSRPDFSIVKSRSSNDDGASLLPHNYLVLFGCRPELVDMNQRYV